MGTDRRIRKTKTALCNALTELMKTQEFHTISVKELCDAADIHRATFYYHYSDIYAFYTDMEAAFLAEIDRLFDVENQHDYEVPFFQRILDYVVQHAQLCELFLSQKTGMRTYRKTVDYIKAKYLRIWQKEMGQDALPDGWVFLTEYHIQGCLAILTAWINSGFSSPQEQIATLLNEIDMEFDTVVARHYERLQTQSNISTSSI